MTEAPVALPAVAEHRLVALAHQHRLDERQRGQLARLLRAVAEDPRAPTTVTDPPAAVEVHVADSLAALDMDGVRGSTVIVDIGSGAGFPGLPLAVALPAARVRLVESSSRKAAFLNRARSAADLANATVVAQRAEDWRAGLGAHDLALARALGPAEVVLEYAAPLLVCGGLLVDWRGRRDEAEEHRARRAADLLGLELLKIHRPELLVGAEHHHLHLYMKVRDTPDRFPRRAGMARKRPLSPSHGG